MHRVGLLISEGGGSARERKEIAAATPWLQLIAALGTGAGDFRLREAASFLLLCQGEAEGVSARCRSGKKVF